jgi:hypothetical protein
MPYRINTDNIASNPSDIMIMIMERRLSFLGLSVTWFDFWNLKVLQEDHKQGNTIPNQAGPKSHSGLNFPESG